MIRRSVVGAAVVGAALTLLLAACAPSSTGAAPSTPPTSPAVAPPTPTPTPTPEPVDPLTTVTTLVATATSLQFVDAQGAVVEEFAYLDEPEPVLAAVARVFDAEPADEELPGSNHTPPSTIHSWGDVEIQVRHYDEERREAESIGLGWPRFAVSFDAPAHGDVDLTTPSGYHAGDVLAEIEPELDPDDWTCVGQGVDVVSVVEYSAWQGADVERRYGVALADWASRGGPPDGVVDDGTVTWVGAPYVVAEGCA